MKKKYRNTGFVILGIFIAAVVSILVIVFIIAQNGLSYIKSDSGIKFFGYIDKNEKIISGRLWFNKSEKNYSANIQPQKFYIVELKDSRYIEYMPELTAINSGGFIDLVNDSLPGEVADFYPFGNFIFAKSSDIEFNGGVFLRPETFDALIKNYENEDDENKTKNIIASGEIYASDNVKWILLASNENPASYKDFEIVQADNNAKKYKGDILSFLDKEKINFASFIFTDKTVINLYSAPDVYRISFDKGSPDGDLYIGVINENFEKSGKGLYYGKSGDIYYGDFSGDARTGKGEILSNTGDIYSGDFENDKKSGYGVFIWDDGSMYLGTFENNMKNGAGVHTFSDGAYYDGEYFEDLKHGTGKYKWFDGDCYEGEYENDIMKGAGRYEWANGDYYEGDFDHNSMHGYGTYYWTIRSYEGWWHMGKMVTEKPDDIDGGGNHTDDTDGIEIDTTG